MEISDIAVGVVISFDCGKIKENMPPIRELGREYGENSQLPAGIRPFVCISKKDGLSQWAELTTEGRAERLFIPVSERKQQDGTGLTRPNGRWKTDPHRVNGAVFEGPDEVWCEVADDIRSVGHFRCVTPQMVSQIRTHLAPQLVDPLFALS